jgi:hypothetical protein
MSGSEQARAPFFSTRTRDGEKLPFRMTSLPMLELLSSPPFSPGSSGEKVDLQDDVITFNGASLFSTIITRTQGGEKLDIQEDVISYAGAPLFSTIIIRKSGVEKLVLQDDVITKTVWI